MSIYNLSEDTVELPKGLDMRRLYSRDEINDFKAMSTSQDLCNHEWVNVGFRFDKYVCKKCDKEKPS